MKGIVVLGSTGSIGRQTLEVIRSFPQEFTVVGLAGWGNRKLLEAQVREFRPPLVWCQGLSGDSIEPGLSGCACVSMEEMARYPDADLVMVATVGKAGLLPTLAALRSGKSVALANKEVMVMAGQLVAQEAAQNGQLLPVDSEPSAIWQCLRGEEGNLARLIITASGGPFRTTPLSQMHMVTPEEALQHPTWQMGRKITIDSATLMNKAFEVIECHWMFDIPWERIDAIVHPQSIVHSLVAFEDGSVKAHLSSPDMRLPIQYALFHPRRIHDSSRPPLDLAQIAALTFEELEPQRYPCFSLALEAAHVGGTYPAALSAADEAAVNLFLHHRIGFLDIPHLVEQVVTEHETGNATCVNDILVADAWARRRTVELAGG